MRPPPIPKPAYTPPPGALRPSDTKPGTSAARSGSGSVGRSSRGSLPTISGARDNSRDKTSANRPGFGSSAVRGTSHDRGKFRRDCSLSKISVGDSDDGRTVDRRNREKAPPTKTEITDACRAIFGSVWDPVGYSKSNIKDKEQIEEFMQAELERSLSEEGSVDMESESASSCSSYTVTDSSEDGDGDTDSDSDYSDIGGNYLETRFKTSNDQFFFSDVSCLQILQIVPNSYVFSLFLNYFQTNPTFLIFRKTLKQKNV